MDTIPLRARVPIYLAALVLAIARTPRDIYNFHARGLGTEKVEPWRSKLSAGVTRCTSTLRDLGQFLWGHRQRLAVAALVGVLLVAPETLRASDLVLVGVAGQVTIEQLQTQFDAAKAEAQSAVARKLDEGTIRAALDRAVVLKKKLEAAQGDANMLGELERITAGMTSRGGSPAGGGSIGAQILNSEMGKWLLKHKGQFPTNWQSPSSELMSATLTTDSASGGALILTDYQPGILPLPTRPLQVADLMAPGTTTSNTVGYLKETSVTNAAAAVAEAAAKPESTIVFEAVSDDVRKIAHWIPVTEEMLEDVPALSAYLDTRMRYFVLLVEDDQLLNGNGTTPNISGILDRADITAPFARTTENNADAILKQITIIEQATNMLVDGIVMHPTNWDNMLMLKDSTGNYMTGGGPFAAPTRKTLWGRNVAVTPAIAVGTALPGAFRTASQFFRRGGLRVEASNSHSDFFIKNLVAIRAEERGALAVYREAAFGLVTNLV